MPQSVLSRERVEGLLASRLSEGTLEELLFLSKAELEHQEGDELTISVTPDRLDLLSEGGLALALDGARDSARGLPPVRRADPTRSVRIQVDPDVDGVRREIAGLVVHAPTDAGIDAGTLAEAIRFQEILHASLGRDRRAASLGIYPLERLEPPVRYALEPMSSVTFVPLDAAEETSASRFFAEHPMAIRYGALAGIQDRCLTLRDARGTVLSLPPVLNGRAAGEARVGDRSLLLEATGTRERAVVEALGLLLVVFAARGYAVESVAVERPGQPRTDGESVIAPHAVRLPSAVLRSVTGRGYSASDVEHLLARARLGAQSAPEGWRVLAPPWRPDLRTAVDVVEEVVLSQGVHPEDGIIPPAYTRGRRRPEVDFRRRFTPLLLGAGYSELLHPVLVGEASIVRLGRSDAIRLANPPSEEFARLRPTLLVSLVDALERNTRYAYPQRFAETGAVVLRDAHAESGGATRYHVGAVLASDTAGFADAAALADYLLRAVDVVGVREPVVISGTIRGRAARVRVAGETVAEIGEVSASVLDGAKVPVPAAWVELDLTSLWPLVRRDGTH